MPADAPKAKLPVFKKVTALVMVVPVALMPRLYPWLAVVKVGVVKAPLKAMVAASVVSVKITLVTVSTLPAKVAPPELVTVTLPMLVPMVRKILTAPVVLITMLDGQ